jgi:hypothetical protein
MVSEHMGHLSGPVVKVLTLWSFGMVMIKACGLTRVSDALASVLKKKENNLRQQLREWYWDKGDKQGKKRVDWQVSESFAPLLKWVVSLWPAEEKRLVLAMDATSLKMLFVVLSISVVYRGCAIPVAWAILPAAKPGSWREPWEELFRNLAGALPADWCVLVMADRGLYAKWLYEAIQSCHWHPFLRINLKSKYRPKGSAAFLPMCQLLPASGSVWAERVTCFAYHSIECTLLACWGVQYQEPWLIVTDLSPEQGSAFWYGMRSWIEGGFKDLKRDGWQWQKTRMSDPKRAARFWLALAVATLWVVCVGGEVDHNLPVCSLNGLPATHIARRTKKRATAPRSMSCFSRGLSAILAALINQTPLPFARFFPEPWPQKTYP